ncbi:MAG: OmpA family protein [Pseudomonadota bacterium]
MQYLCQGDSFSFSKVGRSAAILICFLGAACEGRGLEEAQSLTPSGSPFQDILYDGYLELAELESAEGNYSGADHLAQKATLAAKGQTPLPDSVDPKLVPVDKTRELLAAWDRLAGVTLTTMVPKDYEPLAVAQLAFDCWYQRQQDPVATAELETCRNDFYVAMALVEASPRIGQSAGPTDSLIQLGGGAIIGLVPFEFGGAEISGNGQQILDQILERADKLPDKRVRVVAHTDTVGQTDVNQALAERRANAVIGYLVAAGLDPARIVSEAVGEDQLLELTSDNVRSQANRVAVVDLL